MGRPDAVVKAAPKVCPLPQNIQQGPWLVAGYTQMMLGTRVNKTWNATTKQFEWMTRPGITQGTNGEKRFVFGPSKLI